MAVSSDQRRDQRRRLVLSWKKSSDAGDRVLPDSPRTMAAYDPEAHPEKQRGPAVLVPTGLGRLSLAIVLVLLPIVGALVAASAEQLFGRVIFSGGGRFARTVAAAGAMVEPKGLASLQAWLSQAYLLAAAVVALIVRQMRRHRRDDFKGRFRAWGWMAGLLLVTALAGGTPFGRLIAAAMADATGLTLGPDGLGWWFGLATIAFIAVSLWAVLPLHERLATTVWLGLALVAWAASAVAVWLVGRHPAVALAGGAAWSLAAAFALVAMLVAARSVIREVRGECGVKKPKTVSPKAASVKPVAKAPARPAAEPVEDDDLDPSAFEPTVAQADEAETDYTDGSEQDMRHLSKAERKRLRKLARMNGAAA